MFRKSRNQTGCNNNTNVKDWKNVKSIRPKSSKFFRELMDRKFIDKIIIISNQLPLTSAPILRQNTWFSDFLFTSSTHTIHAMKQLCQVKFCKFGFFKLQYISTHSFPMHPFCTPWIKMFSGGREKVHWEQMG